MKGSHAATMAGLRQKLYRIIFESDIPAGKRFDEMLIAIILPDNGGGLQHHRRAHRNRDRGDVRCLRAEEIDDRMPGVLVSRA